MILYNSLASLFFIKTIYDFFFIAEMMFNIVDDLVIFVTFAGNEITSPRCAMHKLFLLLRGGQQ